jgi:hypothetical protein
MAERARVLAVGGTLLGLIIVGLVAGFIFLGDDSTTPNGGNSSPSPTPTDVRAQVEQAYLHAWDVWADALLRLDTSRLPDVLTGNALDKITAQVDTQRDKNQPVRISVEHDYTITLSSDSKATVDDNYVNHNVRLDPKTMEPIEDDPNDRVRLTFAMTRVGGTWKISEIIGFE